jgi:hypothetical protein
MQEPLSSSLGPRASRPPKREARTIATHGHPTTGDSESARLSVDASKRSLRASRLGGRDARGPSEELQPFNFAFNSSLTTFGFAFPFEAFITCPTKKPNNVSLPDR